MLLILSMLSVLQACRLFSGGEASTYYYDKNTAANNKGVGYDLVKVADANPSEMTVYTYGGKDYKTEAEAKTAANVE